MTLAVIAESCVEGTYDVCSSFLASAHCCLTNSSNSVGSNGNSAASRS